MAETAAGFVGPAIEVVKWVGAPILRQFSYLCCFSSNITSLKTETEKLQVKERDLQGKVDAAENDVQIISGEVQAWLRDSKNIKDETDGILNEVPNVESGCLKLRARFSLSRRAKKTTDRLKELQDRCKFSEKTIALPEPPPATKAVPLAKTYNFDSRKKIEEDIMTTLRGEAVNMVGICGMGGLGKTTMAKRIMNRALNEHVFEEVVMAVVSRPIDELKIQLEIGGSLGLKLEKETSQARVQKLHARLSGTKRILLVLDDVWERFRLEDLGIPCDYKGCTILVTSRNRDVLNAMNVQRIFGMKVLSEEDSWFLFKEKAGICVDDTEVNSIAKEVINECGRLPIALITVGSALKDMVHVSAWKNALRQLKRRDPDIQNFIPDVYYPLKLSYDVLDSKYKSVFLLCCLYPEDAHIPLENLTYFCMGLRLLEGAIGNVEEERNRMHSLTKVLKDRSLLLDSNRGDDYVRMHDVVRDVCIYIANKQEGYIGDNDLTSSLQRYKLHSGFELLQMRNSSDEEIKFDGIRDLYVLSIESCSQLTSLPFTQRPNNLITLVLDSCEGLETLSVVGELVNLEILICHNCDSIEELPPEIKGLNRLKVLDLTECENLQRIGRGIVSSLMGLEELRMLGSFKKWEGEDREERENAGLKELEVLTKLRCLEIEIEDLALAAENIRLPSEVDRFTIRFLYETRLFSKFDGYLSNKKMLLNWEGASCLGDWIEVQLLRDTECLLLVGNGANKVGLTNLEKKIRYLELRECESMKKVVTSSMDKGGATVFPSIEHLILYQLPKLEEICDDRISSNSFQNLKTLKLDDLPVLKQLWMSSQNNLGKDFLPQLEVLSIWKCGMMETVFLWKGEDGNENTSCHHITKIFPKLKELELRNLPNLMSLCQGIEGIEFPLMRKIEIIECGKMKGMVWNEKISGGSSNNASIHALFCPQQVSFSELEELIISGCQGILSLFTSSMARNLVNLQVLSIGYCDKMVEVIKDDEEKGMSGGRQTALLFPKLQKLTLWPLPKLVSFCESKGIESIQFPVLRSMQIIECGKMKGMVANGVTSNENNSGGSSTNAADIIHLFCQSKQVSFGCLQKLDTDRNSFCELEELKIFGCQSILTLFTSSMAGNLVNLKELWISCCDEMVEVIKDDEEKGMSGGRQTALLFPKLHKLMLSRLPKLVSFCESKGIESIQFPVLRIMKITECGKMKGMVANGVTSNDNNSGDDSSNASDTIHLFCESQQVSFGCVKELEIDWNPFCSNTIHVSLFNGLEKLTIRKCVGSPSLFMSSVAGNFLSLEVLNISGCDEMVEVIKDEEEKGTSGDQRAILFPKLHTLKLRYLHNLVSFCKWKCDVEFPSLRRVEICKCPNMKNFTLGSLAAPNLEYFKTDLNNYFLQVLPFNIVKELSVEENEKPLNCYQIHGSVFDRLEVLDISWYKGSMSLFSSSITGNLVNLTRLDIRYCRKMVKVIEEKEEEKEKVVSGAQRTTILFPKLHKIVLRYLPELVRFCEWKCDVELPSLTEVEIYQCHNMKSFTLGHLNTPNLEMVKIGDEELDGGVKDLNGLVQQRYLSREEEDEEEEEEEEGEEDEDGGGGGGGDDDDDEKREEQN